MATADTTGEQPDYSDLERLLLGRYMIEQAESGNGISMDPAKIDGLRAGIQLTLRHFEVMGLRSAIATPAKAKSRSSDD